MNSGLSTNSLWLYTLYNRVFIYQLGLRRYGITITTTDLFYNIKSLWFITCNCIIYVYKSTNTVSATQDIVVIVILQKS